MRNGKAELLSLDAFPLGLFSDADYEEYAVPTFPGDIFVFASDGIFECSDASGNEYGAQRLSETVVANNGLSADLLVQRILESVRNHSGDETPQDDQTLIVLKIA